MTPERVARWREARRILAIRLDGMGDLLMTTPAFRALKQSAPGRTLTVLTSKSGAEAARLVPEVDAVIEYAAPWMKAPSDGCPGEDLACIEQLREERFEAAVIFTLHSQSPLPAALACYLAGIPLRIARCRENPYHLLTDWIREDEVGEPQRHDVRRQLDLCARIGATANDEHLSLSVSEDARASAIQQLQTWGLVSGPWCVLHPGASAASRRYPPESFVAAATDLAFNHGWRFLVTGGPGEQELCEEVAGGIGPAAIIAPAGSLESLAALIETAPLLISNNTGPVHIAAAVGTPVVDLYALTNPQHTPWQVPQRTLSHDVPCKYCYRSVCPEVHNACIRLISPRDVVAAALALTTECPPPGRIGEASYA